MCWWEPRRAWFWKGCCNAFRDRASIDWACVAWGRNSGRNARGRRGRPADAARGFRCVISTRFVYLVAWPGPCVRRGCGRDSIAEEPSRLLASCAFLLVSSRLLAGREEHAQMNACVADFEGRDGLQRCPMAGWDAALFSGESDAGLATPPGGWAFGRDESSRHPQQRRRIPEERDREFRWPWALRVGRDLALGSVLRRRVAGSASSLVGAILLNRRVLPRDFATSASACILFLRSCCVIVVWIRYGVGGAAVPFAFATQRSVRRWLRFPRRASRRFVQVSVREVRDVWGSGER